MRKVLLATALSAILAGCASGPRYMAADGGYSNPYRSGTGSVSNWSAPYYDDRYWPPVVEGQSFPPQMMDGGSLD